MGEQQHRSDARTLGRRTLEGDFRALKAVLRAGMSVLDVGCGVGAITLGIAEAVGLAGRVVGVDRDEALLAIARERSGGVQQLSFAVGNLLALGFEGEFDVAASARVLQWVAEPGVGVYQLAKAVKKGGHVVVLDYNHAANDWDPKPPAEFGGFYSKFLEWRARNGWDNWMGDNLAEMFRAAGLADVSVTIADEVSDRGDKDFHARAGIWVEVMDAMGLQFCEADALAGARRAYMNFANERLQEQRLSLRAVVGTRIL